MKSIAILSVLLFSALSHADIINCTFTEPFLDTSYSMTQSTLTYRSIDGKVTIVKDVSLQIKGAGVFELVSKDDKVIQQLTLNGQGSNGMSDQIYPYSVNDYSMTQFSNGGVGGCTSNYLKINAASGHQ